MTTALRDFTRPAFVLLFGMLLAVAIVLVSPPGAQAHDSLIESSPAAGEQVETLPAELVLTYSAQLFGGEGATEVTVVGPEGDVVADEPVLSGNTVTVPLAEFAASGEYLVTWRVVSSDGHPISEEFSFEVLTATVAPEPEPEATTPAETSEPSEEPEAIDETDTTDEVAAPTETDATDADDRNFFSPLVLAMIVLGAGFVVVLAFVAFRGRSGAKNKASDAGEGR